MARQSGAQVDLDGAWSFCYSLETPRESLASMSALEAAGLHFLACQVPGSFYLDLYHAGLIDDPRDATTLPSLYAYERAHVWYCRRFDLPSLPQGRPYLTFEGLDCCADVYLNGALLGSTANALVPQRLSTGAALQERNELVVHIRPAVTEAARSDYVPGLWAPPGHWEQLTLRRAPHTYGSGITPRAVSPGLWRSVHLDYEPQEHLGQTFLETLSITPSRSAAQLALYYDLSLNDASDHHYELGIEMRCRTHIFADTRMVAFKAGRWDMTLRDPQLWWPRGRGEANLYACRLTLLRDGLVVDERSFSTGVRTLVLAPVRADQDTEAVARGFLVNGEPVFVLGATWGPADCYHLRDRQRIPDLVAKVVDLGCNLIRCWGGNVYADDLLFELCDRHGILIWQELAMDGAIYPQDDVFCAALRDEVRAVVRRLRQHPSLAVWVGDCGGDETWRAHGRGERRRPEANRLTRVLLPRVLADEDPDRPYLPSAPAAEPLRALAPSGRQETARPITGATCCSSPDLLKALTSAAQTSLDLAGEVWPDEAVVDGKLDQMLRQVRTWLSGVSDDPAVLSLASQIVLAEGLKAQIEGRRAQKWATQGVIWSHLADACAQISSAVIDHAGKARLAYAAVKRAQQPLLLVLQKQTDGGHQLVACSDLRRDEQVQFWVSDVDSDEILIEGEGRVVPDAVTELGRIPLAPGIQRCLLIEWRDASGALFRNYYVDGPLPYDLTRYQLWLYKAELWSDPGT